MRSIVILVIAFLGLNAWGADWADMLEAVHAECYGSHEFSDKKESVSMSMSVRVGAPNFASSGSLSYTFEARSYDGSWNPDYDYTSRKSTRDLRWWTTKISGDELIVSGGVDAMSVIRVVINLSTSKGVFHLSRMNGRRTKYSVPTSCVWVTNR